MDFQKIRDAALELLEPYGVMRLSLFGSVARGEETPESDIDLLVLFEQPRRKPLTIFGWMDIEEELARQFGRKVDLVSERYLSPYILPYAEKDRVVLYESAG